MNGAMSRGKKNFTWTMHSAKNAIELASRNVYFLTLSHNKAIFCVLFRVSFEIVHTSGTDYRSPISDSDPVWSKISNVFKKL